MSIKTRLKRLEKMTGQNDEIKIFVYIGPDTAGIFRDSEGNEYRKDELSKGDIVITVDCNDEND